MPALDLTGQQYGRLTPLRLAPKRGKHTRWVCQCDCGNETVASTSDLRTGNTTSCGCYMRQRQREGQLTHGATGRSNPRDPVYRVWTTMKERCSNPQNKNFARYGGRGIYVCERWRESYEAFRDDMGPRPAGYSVERKDNDGPYSPENCIWASQKTQMMNRRVTILVEHDGETICASDYAKLMGISSKRLYKVMSTRGLSPKDAAVYVREHRRKPE